LIRVVVKQLVTTEKIAILALGSFAIPYLHVFATLACRCPLSLKSKQLTYSSLIRLVVKQLVTTENIATLALDSFAIPYLHVFATLACYCPFP